MEADLFKTDVKKLFSNICNEEKLQRKKRRFVELGVSIYFSIFLLSFVSLKFRCWK